MQRVTPDETVKQEQKRNCIKGGETYSLHEALLIILYQSGFLVLMSVP